MVPKPFQPTKSGCSGEAEHCYNLTLIFIINARKAHIFNVHTARVSTTSAQGRIRIGVNNRIITAFGLDNRKVALLRRPTIDSVMAPSTAPATISCQSTSVVIVDAST